jgi:hypothetical protein
MVVAVGNNCLLSAQIIILAAAGNYRAYHPSHRRRTTPIRGPASGEWYPTRKRDLTGWGWLGFGFCYLRGLPGILRR